MKLLLCSHPLPGSATSDSFPCSWDPAQTEVSILSPVLMRVSCLNYQITHGHLSWKTVFNLRCKFTCSCVSAQKVEFVRVLEDDSPQNLSALAMLGDMLLSPQ